ncbi:hypothetical protein TNCV_4191701 [Trichonephila clavipes]|nr:hypothetical protein TNCV_4191701 [Trichonephila clavipes]
MEDDIVRENGDSSTNSKVSYDKEWDESFSKHYTDGDPIFIAKCMVIARFERILKLKVVRQPMRVRPTVPNSVCATLGPEVYQQMFRSGGQSDAKTPSVKLQSKLGTPFIDPLKGSKAE